MSNEFKLTYTGSATTKLNCIIQNAAGQFWNTVNAAFEAYTAANVANYGAIPMAQIGATDLYMGSFPSAINTAGKFHVVCFLMAGASLAVTDMVAATSISQADIEWSGTAEISTATQFAANATAVAANNTAIAAVNTAVGVVNTNLGIVNTNVTTQAATLGTIGTAVAAIAGLVTSVAALPANIVQAIKVDALLAKTWNSVLKKFNYVPSTGVYTGLQDDGATVIGTKTLTVVSGTITNAV